MKRKLILTELWPFKHSCFGQLSCTLARFSMHSFQTLYTSSRHIADVPVADEIDSKRLTAFELSHFR